MINHPALDYVLGNENTRNYSVQNSDKNDDNDSAKTKFNIFDD